MIRKVLIFHLEALKCSISSTLAIFLQKASAEAERSVHFIPAWTNKQLCSSSICILPDLWSHGYPASSGTPLFAAAPGAALSSTVQISVCLPYPDSTDSSLLGSPAQPCAPTTTNKATFPRDGASQTFLLSSQSAPVVFAGP